MTDPGRLVATGTYKHGLAAGDRGFFIEDAPLGIISCRPHMLFDDTYPFDDNLAGTGQDLQDFAGFTLVGPG